MNRARKSHLIVSSLIATLLLASSSNTPGFSAENDPGKENPGQPKAKQMFQGQLEANRRIENIGLEYSIELLRDGKTFIVDNRYRFRSGDHIRFHVRPNIDGYLYITIADESGDSRLLFPFEQTNDNQNHVAKGVDVVVPRKGVLTFDQRAGIEALTLVLSPTQLTQESCKSERRVTVNPKTGAFSVPNSCSVNINPLNEQGEPVARKYGNNEDLIKDPAFTIVSTDLQNPLVVDLFLKHEPDSKESYDRSLGESPAPDDSSREDETAIQKPHPAKTSHRIEDGVIADKWAVVVGISDFKMPALNLRYPDKDAQDIADFLTKRAHFAADHVKVLTNSQATKEEILKAIGTRWLPSNAKPEDLVFIFFASHGTTDEFDPRKKNYIVAYDTDPFHLPATGIELGEFARNVIGKLPSKRVAVVLDTCYAGALLPGSKSIFDLPSFNLDALMQGTGHLIIGSASRQQSAHDSLRYPNGIFTKQLIDGLTIYPNLSDAFRYAKVHVEEESIRDFGKPQTPVMKDSDWKGTELRLTVPPMEHRTVID